MKILQTSYDWEYDPLVSASAWRTIAAHRLSTLAPEIASQSRSICCDENCLWNRYFGIADLRWIDFYSSRTSMFCEEYVPDDVFFAVIDPYLNKPRRAMEIDDKCLYERYFPDVKQPRTIVRVINKHIYDHSWRMVDLDEAVVLCVCAEGSVFKQATASCGGQGVRICSTEASVRDAFKRVMLMDSGVIVQEKIKQHHLLDSLNSGSVNTIRVITYVRANGEIVPLSSVVRVGKPGMAVDNVSLGGCTVGVTAEGITKQRGFSAKGYEIDVLPSGLSLDRSFAIPAYEQIVNQAIGMHVTFCQHRLIAWDFSVSEEEEPILIEFNPMKAQIDFMQLNNGPLFGPYLLEILEEIHASVVNHVG